MVTQDTAHERAMAAVAGALDLVRQVGRLGRRPAQHVLGNVGRFTYLLIDLARGLAEWRGFFFPPPPPAAHNRSRSPLFLLLPSGGAGGGGGPPTGDPLPPAPPPLYPPPPLS